MDMAEIHNEKRSKSFKEIYGNTSNQWKEMNKADQVLKVEIEPIKDTN